MFWVHAGSAARFEQSYRDIADQVKIRGRQNPKADVVKLVRDWLRDPSHGPWLLILDNLDNLDDTQGWSEPQAPHAKEIERGNQTGRHEGHPQLLASYLPYNEHGRVLLTTRSRGVALTLVEEKNIIVVEPMTHSNAITLCEKKLGSVGGGEDKGQLVKALEYMPLAIVQAAAYIVQRAPRCSVQQYLEDFRRSDRKKISLLDYEGGRLRRDQEAQNSIIITWQISFNHIRQARASAAELLSLMCFFDREGIPDALVRKRTLKGVDGRGQDELDEQTDQVEEGEDDSKISEYSEDNAFEDDVLMLRNYSFLSIETNQTFAMHALAQVATRSWLAVNGHFEQWNQLYIQNLSAEFPSGKYENWSSCQVLLSNHWRMMALHCVYIVKNTRKSTAETSHVYGSLIGTPPPSLPTKS